MDIVLETFLINSYKPIVSIKHLSKSESYNNWNDVELLSLVDVIKARLNNQIRVSGMICIPRINLNVPISNATNNINYTLGAGTLIPTKLDGSRAITLGAHNLDVKSSDALFTPLYYRSKLSDKVYVSDFKTVAEYSISQKKIIKSTDVKKVLNIRSDQMSLITCTPDNQNRTLVTCNLIKTYPFKYRSGKLKSFVDKKYILKD
jgi:sortase A